MIRSCGAQSWQVFRKLRAVPGGDQSLRGNQLSSERGSNGARPISAASETNETVVARCGGGKKDLNSSGPAQTMSWGRGMPASLTFALSFLSFFWYLLTSLLLANAV